MAKNLGSQVVGLLGHERTDLRAAAATVLAAVGQGDDAVVEGLAERLADPDVVVRRIALDGLAAMGATGLAPRLVPLLRDPDRELAERAAVVLAAQGAGAEASLRREVGRPDAEIAVRRAVAGLLLGRGSAGALDAVLEQLADPAFGEQALQLLRAEIDRGNEKLAPTIEKGALARAAEVGKALKKSWARALAQAEAATGKGTSKGKGRARPAAVPSADGTPPATPVMDPAVATAVHELGLLLRLIGYQARASALPLLLAHVSDQQPRSIRLAAIAALRRVVASGEAKGTDRAIEVLIELAGATDDPAVAQSAIDTLRGARVPERLAKPFAALVRSKNPAAQKLAMERLPAGGGAVAIKALIEALGGADPAARDAAARGLARAPEAAVPLLRALLGATDPEVARRYAGQLRGHKAQLGAGAIDELAAATEKLLERHARGKADADAVLLERLLLETLANLAPARHVELLFDYARRLRRGGKPAEAFGALRPLLRSRADLDAAIDDDRRFTLAVLGLETLGQGILRPTGADAPVLEQFARLAHRGYPVARKLAREKDVGDADIYALGFRLLESREGDNQELGAELMQGLIDERPRSKLAKNARNKLKLAGWAA